MTLNVNQLKYEYVKYNFPYLALEQNLYNEYVINRNSLTELNSKHGIDYKSVGFLLDYFNINKRTIKDSVDIMLKHSKITFNLKYGVDNPWDKDGIGYNTRISNLKTNYDVVNVSQIQYVKDKIKISNNLVGHTKRKNTMLDRYGYTSPFQVESIHRLALLNSGKRITKLNLLLYDALTDDKFEYIKEFYIKDNKRKYFYDVKVGNILIEINGDYWHANPTKHDKDWYNVQRKQHAREIWKQDLIKKNIAIENGYKFITIWEQDIKANTGHLNEYIKNKVNTENK